MLPIGRLPGEEALSRPAGAPFTGRWTAGPGDDDDDDEVPIGDPPDDDEDGGFDDEDDDDDDEEPLQAAMDRSMAAAHG